MNRNKSSSDCQYSRREVFIQKPPCSYMGSNYTPCPPCVSPPVSYTRPKPVADGCCTSTIRQVLQMVQSVIAQMGIAGFQVDVVITLKSGIEYTIPFSSDTLKPVMVGQDILTYGNVAISLCDIAKIDILSSQVAQTTFAAQITALLNKITTNYCQGYPDPQHPCCDMADCSCVEGMQDYAFKQKSHISAINYDGAYQQVVNLSAITNISSSSVIDNVIISPVSLNVVTGASISTATVPVVSAIATTPVSAITNLTTIPQTNLSNVIPGTTTVSAAFTATPTTVVTGISTVPSSFIGVTSALTAQASSAITVAPTTVATGITTVPATLLSNVTNATVQAASPFATSTATVVTAASSATVTMVTAVNTIPRTVVGSFTTIPVTVNTAYPNPVSVDGVLSDLATADSVATQQETLPVITAAPGGLFVNVNGATLPILDSNGNPVIIGAPLTINVVSAATNLLGGLTNAPALTDNVLTGLGVPTTTQLISNVVPATVTALANATTTTTTLSYLSGATTATINAITQAPSTVTVVSSIATVPQTVNTVGAATLQSVNVVSGTPTLVNVLSSITTIPQTINSVSAISLSRINSVSGTPASVTVVNSLSTIAQTVSAINTITPATLSQISSVTAGSAIGSVTLTTSTGSAVQSVSALPQYTSVLQSVGVSNVSVLSPVTVPIEGSVETVGSGILVVTLPNEDISVLSLCDVQSIETQ